MSEKTEVSIIIPTYNAAHYLREALASVAAQTYTCWEALVINNYSQDNTEEVVASFNDPRIKLINFRNHGIIGASRNEGIRIASGQWIALLDADDRWLPDKLERCFQRMLPNTDLLAHGITFFGEGWTPWKMAPKPTNHCGLRRLLFSRENQIPTCTVLVKKSLVDKVGGFRTEPEYLTAEDWDLWLRLAEAGCRMQCIEDYLGEYRLHGQNASSSDRPLQAGLHTFNEHFAKLGTPSLLDRILGRRKRAMFYYTAGKWRHDRGILAAKLYYWQSFKMFPFNARLIAMVAMLTFGLNLRRPQKAVREGHASDA